MYSWGGQVMSHLSILSLLRNEWNGLRYSTITNYNLLTLTLNALYEFDQILFRNSDYD